MRIGIFHPKAAVRHASGLSIFVQEIAKRLSRDHDVFLYTEVNGHKISESISSSDVNVIDIGNGTSRWKDVLGSITQPFRHLSYLVPRAVGYLGAIKNGITEHINNSVDVLLTHIFVDDIFISQFVDVPVIYRYSTFHQVDMEVRAREYFSKSTSVLASSTSVADNINTQLGYDVDGIVRAGVDIEKFSPDVRPAFEKDSTTVLYAGRFVESKGIYDLIDAVTELTIDCHLSLVGGRGNYDEVIKYIRESGISEYVSVHGTVPHDKIPQYYATCDIFCLPSYYESFGMVNLEAMASGRPVITTDVEGITEYATDGENALLVTPGNVNELRNSISRLVEDLEYRSRLGQNGRQCAQQFTWDKQVEKLEFYCKKAIENN